MKTPITIIMVLHCLTSMAQYSGGPLSPEQAAYDVNYYDLNLNLHPDTKTIDGSLLCRAIIVEPLDTLVMDLLNYYTVDSILLQKNNEQFASTEFTHVDKLIKAIIPGGSVVADTVTVKVYYRQTSVIPNNSNVIFWKTTPAGNPWISVACESKGSDYWWPCKDHPSDEPDSVSLSFTAPNPLDCISNGKLISTIDNGNGTSTFNWFVSTPINNYCITVYVADYSLIEDEYVSVSGDTIPFYFWVIPESYDEAVAYMDVFRNEFDFLESINGPFPFGIEKHGWAHSWIWGMEHQTIIAYGNNFELDSWGMDYIHYHELAHEWWGNLITAKNWNDVWIHEGIATYTEALYVEHLSGIETYFDYMAYGSPNVPDNPLAPREEQNASAIYENDPYWRGSWVMHTLRYHLGDSVFMNLLKRWAYPDSTDYDNTNGRQCRLMTTDDMMNQAEEVTGRELDNFFEVFFREVQFPVLIVDREADTSWFTWDTETDVPLDLNVPVLVNGIPQTVVIVEGTGFLAISAEDSLVVDPDKWILMKKPIVTRTNQIIQDTNKEFLSENFPNPFSDVTTIKFTIPEDSYVTIEITDLLGKKIRTLISEYLRSGMHQIDMSAKGLKAGVYNYTLKAKGIKVTRRMMII